MPEPAPVVPAWRRGLRRLRLAFDTWYPWDQRKVQSKLQPLVFRRLEERDIEWCEKLYARNERYGIPESGRSIYSGFLQENGHLVVIAEDAEAARVGTFGIHWSEEATGFLSYVLVDPGVQRSGIGATMLLAAISLLGIDKREKYLVLNALDCSLGFYRKMGFVELHREMVDGQPLNYAVLGPLDPQLIADCGALLRTAGARAPDLSADIPPPPRLPIAAASTSDGFSLF